MPAAERSQRRGETRGTDTRNGNIRQKRRDSVDRNRDDADSGTEHDKRDRRQECPDETESQVREGLNVIPETLVPFRIAGQKVAANVFEPNAPCHHVPAQDEIFGRRGTTGGKQVFPGGLTVTPDSESSIPEALKTVTVPS